MKEIKLLPHQVQALKATEGKTRCAYYLDMGLGKTFVASEKAVTEMNSNKILVVCQKSKIADWIDHFKTYYSNYNVIEYSKPGTPIDDKTVAVINYDKLRLRPELLKLKGYTLILDESSYIKSSKSARTKFVLKMKPDGVLLLSGTPVGGKYEELLTQISLLGWKITKREFWDTFVIFYNMDVGGFYLPKVTGYKNVDLLKQKLRDHGAIFMKNAIELPPTMEYKEYVSPTPQYKKYLKDKMVSFDGVELVGETSLVELMHLRQLAALYNKNKYDKVVELLESTEDRIIIFYSFNEECDKLRDICNKLKRPVSVVNGSNKDLVAYEEESNSVTLIQYQAGAMGLNLQKANKILYFSLPQSSELFEQSKKRTHRLGQDRTCFYYYLLTRGSIEEKILSTLEQRKNYTNDLFKEDFKK